MLKSLRVMQLVCVTYNIFSVCSFFLYFAVVMLCYSARSSSRKCARCGAKQHPGRGVLGSRARSFNTRKYQRI